MQTKDLIEEIICRELRSLCANCTYERTCLYHNTTGKTVIQCEMFVADMERDSGAGEPKGLCKTCDFSSTCKMDGRRSGVWHCDQFQ